MHAYRHRFLVLYVVVVDLFAAERNSLGIVAEPVIKLCRNVGIRKSPHIQILSTYSAGPGNPVL